MATATAEKNIEKKGQATKTGNLTREPELRFSDKDVAYCRFGLAVERPVKPGDWAGERTIDFYDVVSFRSLAEHVAQSLHKGDRVVVTGEAELEHWTDKEGKSQTTRRVVADAVGAELRFATVDIRKPGKGGAGSGAPAPGPVDDEEPF